MGIFCEKTFVLVPIPMSSVKVKVEYQGHNFQQMALVFHKQILLISWNNFES